MRQELTTARSRLKDPPATLGDRGASLRFDSSWCTTQIGHILAGGTLSLDYDILRLPQCRASWRGAQVWDIEVHIRLHPGGTEIVESVLDKIRSPPGRGMVTGLVPRRVVLAIPSGAEKIEMWFRNWYQTSSRCESWDSRYCQNYWFPVEQA